MMRLSITDLLNPSVHKWAYSSPLRKFAINHQKNAEIKKIVQHALGGKFQDHLVDAQLIGTRLLLFVDSAAYASQFRLMSPQLLEKLSSLNEFQRVKKVKIRTTSVKVQNRNSVER